MEDTIKLLKELNLTEYESKSYVAMVNLIYAKADEISKESGVPRSKIYEVLENLEKKGFIKIKMGRPLEYEVLPPDETFNNYKLTMEKNINKLKNTFTEIYDSKIPNINTPIISIENKEKIIKKQYELIKRGRKVVLMRIGFIIPEEIENFKKLIMYLLKKEIIVKILASRKCVINNEEVSIEDLFEDIPVDIKYINLPSAQLIIRDYKEMILVFAENRGKSISDDSMVGLLNTYPTIIKNYAVAFNKHWNMKKTN